MSSAHSSHCACPDPQVVAIPGVQGDKGTDGINGTNGSDGINAFTIVAGAGFTVPAADGTTPVTIPVMTSVWCVIGENIFVETAGVFRVTAVPTTASVTAVYLPYSVNTNAGNPVIAGRGVTPTGYQPSVGGLGALTDNTGGTPSGTLAAQAGRLTLAFYIQATAIANGDLLTAYVPGYAFTLVKFDARCAVPVTTTPCASNLNLKITGVPVTGGVIALSGAYAQGAAQAGTALSGPNVGLNTSSITIFASGTTAFTEGAFWLIIELQNMDTADAFASLANKVNVLIATLA